MKGGYQSSPRLEISTKSFACLIELTSDRPDVNMGIMAEYYPMAKINSIPGNATAHHRVPYPNVVNFIRWKENTPENLSWARSSSRKIMDIITDGSGLSGDIEVEGYGNYGK
jgi:hypothetical protein